MRSVFSTDGTAPWQRQASPLARAGFVAYALMAIYSGLAPWAGWRDLGISPWAYLTAPVPRYVTSFDLVVNVLAYLPLGVLGVLALHPRYRKAGALLLTTLAALLLSGCIEALQTYLPSRVASNLDLITNVGGALLGALFTLPFSAALIDRGRLAQLRSHWFTADASVLLLLLLLWPAAQTYPGPLLFGNGRVFEEAELLTLLQWINPAQIAISFGPAEFVLAEAFVVLAAVLAVGLTVAAVTPRSAPRSRLLLGYILLVLAIRALSYAVVIGPEQAFIWLSPGALGGLALGVLALLVSAYGSARAQLRAALLVTVLWLLAVNLIPSNPYHSDWLTAYRPGRLAHFSALAAWLSLAWPFALIAALLTLAAKRRRLVATQSA